MPGRHGLVHRRIVEEGTFHHNDVVLLEQFGVLRPYPVRGIAEKTKQRPPGRSEQSIRSHLFPECRNILSTVFWSQRSLLLPTTVPYTVYPVVAGHDTHEQWVTSCRNPHGQFVPGLYRHESTPFVQGSGVRHFGVCIGIIGIIIVVVTTALDQVLVCV
jgi:hypothetical protein